VQSQDKKGIEKGIEKGRNAGNGVSSFLIAEKKKKNLRFFLA